MEHRRNSLNMNNNVAATSTTSTSGDTSAVPMTTAPWRHPTEIKPRTVASSQRHVTQFPLLRMDAVEHARASLPSHGTFAPDMMPRLLELSYGNIPLCPMDEEVDTHRLSQRMKQIAFGKNTPGYQVYAETIRRCDRQFGNPNHPVTPRLSYKCPKRSWDNLVGQWRRALHLWDEHPAPEEMGVVGLPTLTSLGLEDDKPDDEDETPLHDEEGAAYDTSIPNNSFPPTPSRFAIDGILEDNPAAATASPQLFTFQPRASPYSLGRAGGYGGPACGFGFGFGGRGAASKVTPNRFFNNVATPQSQHGSNGAASSLLPGQSPCGVSALREDSIPVPPQPRLLVFQDSA